jgi:NAD(P)-dependent dehydrogenase (short-subunit alcohol dehydrogenase family)
MQLNDVAVLITGGGSGLGAATARAMAAKGAKIGVIDQNKENAEKVAAEVKGVALHADVTDEDAIKAAIAKAEAAHGIARVLMNCAGIGGSQRTVGKDGVYPLAKFVRICACVPNGWPPRRRSAKSAASPSTPRASRLMKARSARSPIRLPRAVSSASRCRRRAISPASRSASTPSRPACS